MNLKEHVQQAIKLTQDILKGEPVDPDYCTFAIKVERTPRYQRILATAGPLLASEALFEFHKTASWIEHGLTVYRPTPALTASLLLTDPSNIDTEDIREPFPTFVVILPDNFWFLTDEKGNNVSTNRFWVHRYKMTYPDEVARRILTACGVQINKRTHLYLSTEKDITRVYVKTIHPTNPEGSLTQWLNNSSEDTNRENLFSAINPVNVGTTDVDERLLLAMRRFYINLCLYIAERGPGQRQHRYKKRHKNVRTKNKIDGVDVWVLGKEIELHPDTVRSAQEWVLHTQGKKSQWQLRKRFTVTGHWRNQPCGLKLTQRKLRWIEPYWKGPKDGEKISHIYTDAKRKRKKRKKKKARTRR